MAQGVARSRPNFLEMLAQNPRGWGPSGAASPEEGVADRNELEAFRERFRSVYGPAVEAAIPYLPEKGREMAQEAQAQAPYLVAGPVLGGAARLVSAAPRAAAAIGGAAGMLGLTGGAGEGSEGALQELLKQRASLDRQRALAVEERDAQLKGRDGRKAGRGPVYDEKNREVQRLTDEMKAIDAMIGEESKRSSPEYQMELKKKAETLAAEKKAKEAATPFREKYPGAANALSIGGSLAALGAPLILRGGSRAMTYLGGSNASRLNRAVKEANEALDAGDLDKAQRIALELQHAVGYVAPTGKNRSPSVTKRAIDMVARLGKRAGSAAAPIVSGGFLAAEGSMLPDQIDMQMLPEGKAREMARERAMNPMNYVDRAATGALTGVAGYEFGGLVPTKNPNAAAAKAVIDFISQMARAPKAAKPPSIGGVRRATRKPRGKGAND